MSRIYMGTHSLFLEELLEEESFGVPVLVSPTSALISDVIFSNSPLVSVFSSLGSMPLTS